MMYLPLLLSSLLCLTYGIVYTVTPDDHPNTTCHFCHNLQHYLRNTTKYFTSNTQLLFLPGLHHLYTDLIMYNVHNISLIGTVTNSFTLGTVIQCNSSVGIVISNITDLIMANMTILECQNRNYYKPDVSAVLIADSSFVMLTHLTISGEYVHHALLAINIFGDSHFSHIKANGMCFFYNKSQSDIVIGRHNLSISHFQIAKVGIPTVTAILKFHAFFHYKIRIKLSNITIRNVQLSDIIEIGFSDELDVLMIINGCHFSSNSGNSLVSILRSSRGVIIDITNCQFFDNKRSSNGLITTHHIYSTVNVYISNSMFHNNHDSQILRLSSSSVTIHNTTFSANVAIKETLRLIGLQNTRLSLIGPVTFYAMSRYYSIISVQQLSTVLLHGFVEFSNNTCQHIIAYGDRSNNYLMLYENTSVTIANNKLSTIFLTDIPFTAVFYPPCFFQYTSNTNLDTNIAHGNYSVTITNNKYSISNSFYCYNNIPILHCYWLPQSAFNLVIPIDVNQHYIVFQNNSGTFNELTQCLGRKQFCVCNLTHSDCYRNEIGMIYPGQTLTTSICQKNTVRTHQQIIVRVDIRQPYIRACKILNGSQISQFFDKNDTKLTYTIEFSTDVWCELFLQTSSDFDYHMDVFYVRQRRCPPGFVKSNGVCQCDKNIIKLGITNCNINEQTVLRLPNSWMYATTHNNSYVYQVTLQCPFHYCLPHSSHLNFSTPNSQCQFNRSGLLCGHCQQGLSTVFGFSHCQQCSNIYLFLVVPIAMVGLLLVFILFNLNLTVTDGTISAFILYVNVISVNSSLFFPHLHKYTPTYLFISLANLDLGVQICFYNGMDDYAKMWLQLAFPFYLIFIATSLIITSRYSTTIQRLTARRALPVLATLFLLSYTKTLLIVSSVLFSYSKLIHLPSEHVTILWSVDANVPLFGVRFTILFIACLMLFLILMPFTIVLLFTKMLSRLKFVIKFKPLLDACQGPYKLKRYYWVGVQLLIRVLFFALSSLERKINLTVGVMILGIIGAFHGVIRPFKVKYKNYQEMLFILNLQWMFSVSLYNENSSKFIDVLIAVAAIHFSVIVIYHIITYVYGGVILTTITSYVVRLSKWFSTFVNKQQIQHFELQENVVKNIPEVTFNYREYREPLLGLD